MKSESDASRRSNRTMSNTSNVSDDSTDQEDTMDIKIAQIFIVLIFSCIGMTGPLYFSNGVSGATLLLLRAFAAGQFFPTIYVFYILDIEI
jgi:hypothetical protein